MLCQPAVIETASWLKEFVRLASDSRAAPNHTLTHFDGGKKKKKLYTATSTARKVIKNARRTRRLSPEMYSLQTAGFSSSS